MERIWIFMKITEDIIYAGVNDHQVDLFEGQYRVPNGMAYNSYVILDEKTAVMDTLDANFADEWLENVAKALDGRKPDYLIVQHMEPDHSANIENFVKAYPEATVVANTKTFAMMKNFFPKMDLAGKKLEVKDGESLTLGKHVLTFVFAPMVHWPEVMTAYEETEKILFSADAFGRFGALERTARAPWAPQARRYYYNIVGKYGGMVQKALAKLSSLDVKTLCSLHGPVWSRQAGEVIGLYDKWSRCEADEEAVIIYASMYNNTAHMANHIADRMAERGVTGVKVYDVSKTHLSYLISEIWRCRYVMLGSCAYNADMFPLMELLCNSMLHYGLKNRELAIFGSCSFGGGGVRSLRKFAEASGWELMCEPVEVTGTATPANLAKFEPLADAVAERIKAGRK